MSETPTDAVPLEWLWAKSRAGGASHSLPGHLLDAVAVAELIWDDFMAPRVKGALDECCVGRGRDVFRLLAGWHDLGKATPPFQAKQPQLAADLLRQGRLSGFGDLRPAALTWRHTHATRVILSRHFAEQGVLDRWAWVPILLEGHHGALRSYGDGLRKNQPPLGGLGDAGWVELQRRLCAWVEDQVGLRLADITGDRPTRAVQLALAGFVVMADWIASCDLLPGLGQDPVTLAQARQRASAAWAALGLRGGWALPDGSVSFAERFGFEPRPLQVAVMAAAEAMERPGLMVVEAPMGEGKTEAALAAVEILARKFGCDGFAFAMPTQGTTDAMYQRCCDWAQRVDPSLQPALVHGKAMMNEDWRRRWEAAPRIPDVIGVYEDTDEYGTPDPYGTASAGAWRASAVGFPSDWLLARHRALLAPGVIMTIDHLLYAGTKTKFVMLRHAGLAGKVVVIDEVHSYDVFMESFLDEVLGWLGEAGVPVILMSATLPPEQRARLMGSYARSALAEAALTLASYPGVVCQSDGGAVTPGRAVESWRPALPVSIEVLGDAGDDVGPIAARIVADLVDGGCALAILNTVGRAQQVARALEEAGQTVILLHGRLTTAERAERTKTAINLLGKDHTRETGRPRSQVVVATQIAEQSFDVDADVLYTDLAPMDLLLQRIGRLHRHQRPDSDRPERLRRPRVVVTGVELGRTGCVYPRAFGSVEEKAGQAWGVYDPWALVRSAAGIVDAPTWQIPTDVPRLVEQAYADTCDWMPPDWQPQEAAAERASQQTRAIRASRAGSYLLGAGCEGRPDLEDLHYLAVSSSGDESVVVRDGEPTREVSLIVDRGDSYETLGGSPLGPNGERVSSDPDVVREVLGDSVRLHDRGTFHQLAPKPEWVHVPLLRSQPVLVLDTNLTADLADCVVRYDQKYGLAIEWKGAKR